MRSTIYQSSNEGDLIKAAVKGDSSCLSELYSRYFLKVVSHCQLLVKDKDTAYDLAQDVLLKAIVKLPSLQNGACFSAWLYSIAHNHCVAYLRKGKKHPTIPLEVEMMVSDDESDAEAQLRHELEERNLHVFLDQLSRLDRRLLVLKYGHNTPVKELQKSSTLSSSAIKMRLKRSRKKLVLLFYRLNSFS